ncbi:4-hyroxy-2-oxovalerate/4-hydroxy-2-oxopentanoic acid aldolase [Alcaligenes faecalis subsp. faecalis NCIB 8687]|nr:4-hyroxy-2-oxovalerate/4-hydroxy-2-oxopentanoic acid aldolase [Alcaligenes faecalis subsp. faecalis NCIB 8687]
MTHAYLNDTHDLKAAYDAGARIVRVATHCTEADVSKQYIEYARNPSPYVFLELGLRTWGRLIALLSAVARS